MEVKIIEHPRNFMPKAYHTATTLTGKICDRMVHDLMPNKDATEFLMKYKGKASCEEDALVIDLYFNSGGGDVWTMTSLYEILKNLKERYLGVTIVTHGVGEVSSAAIPLMALGDTRVLYPGMSTLFHGVAFSGAGRGTENSHVVSLERTKRSNDVVRFLYLQSGLNPEEVERHFADRDTDRYLTHSEILKLGLCTHVIEGYTNLIE